MNSRNKFSNLQLSKTEIQKLPKKKAPRKIALRQKAFSKKSPEKYILLRFDLIEIAYCAGLFISIYLS